MNPYRVLIVDDDPFFLQVYGDFLRSRGFEVEVAPSGEQALHLYAPGRFELAIVDLMMPGISGLELIEKLRTLHPAQDIVVVTAQDDVRTAVRTMRLGVYDYLVKPLEREELMLVIDRLQERATLYDEHARLLHENIMHAEVQQMFQRALRVMHSLDVETVCERLLETLSEVCSAQGATLWLARDDAAELAMHGYRGLVDAAAQPLAWSPEHGPLGKELCRGLPVLAARDLAEPRRRAAPAESLLAPLARDGRLMGLVQLVGKLGGGFDGRDAARAKIICDSAAIALAHARRFRQLERVGLRDAATAAYNMTYFVDYLGRELHKARRYHRSFALVQVAIDNLATLKQALAPEVFREASRRLVLAVASVLREIDVLAQVTDDEMFLLLPEADFLGGLGSVRAARDAILRSPFLADIDRAHPLSISFGPAAFPRDGDDVDQLFSACKRRLHEARRSLFRRLHLEDVDFWGAVDLLIGPDAAYRSGRVGLNGALQATEDEKGISRHHVFPPGFVDLLRREVITEAGRQARSAGWLFLAGSFAPSQAGLSELKTLQGVELKTYLLSSTTAARLASAGVTQVRVEAAALDRHEMVLFLAEHASYGMLARRGAGGAVYGFHTADWALVDGLIAKLQDAYHLQKGAT